ncbi:porin [Paraburkholderia sp. SOS3]|jgi:predicted porin|uniref:porin n=1 Tax=Paraburkholderia sp. SOS3 TaxID=1926494 RepID=UPI0009472E14|nr:porin [Paraburkholderia sp. SOS3]APR38649.1 porin [Paraburkholderia sp. SOS3]
MKRIALSTLSLALLGATSAAHAQSSVTLYGVLDDAFQWVHHANPANDNLYHLQSGNIQGNRWGLKGTEDLGGGLKAIFQLESGFDPNNGKAGQGGRLFGRQAYVGLTQDQYGTLTVGRQYDPLVDMIQPITADNFWGSMFATPGDVDNNDNSSRTNNSFKYVSPVWGGFQFEGMYAFGGVAGTTGSGQSWGGAATYGMGPLNVAAGYFRMDNANGFAARGGALPTAANPLGTAPGWSTGATSDATFDGSTINSAYASAKSISITSAAAQYVVGPFTFNARYSFAQYKPDAFSAFSNQEKYHVAGAYAGYQLSPALLLGLGYTWTHGAGDTSSNYHQVSAGADYSLSKRTDVYLMGAYQHASGTQRVDAATTTDAKASIGSYGFQAGSNTQEMVSIGIRHKF